jgi:hypothetical protein
MNQPIFIFEIFASFSEGMRFVQEAVLKNSESSCRRDGKQVTISAVGMLQPAGGLTGDARESRSGVTLRFSE